MLKKLEFENDELRQKIELLDQDIKTISNEKNLNILNDLYN